MSYPILYKSNETDFFAMGLGPIQMLKATVTQERNGIFVFEGEILTDNPLFPLVLENCIIKADADHLLKDQRFRIKRIVPNHDGKAQIYAEHVSYLSRELTIKPEVNITGSAQIALSQWKASIVESNPFVVSSDITTSASTKWRIDKVENPMMALGGVEGSILDRWGGEYLFDNYHISLLKKRGKTATNILAYGRNITDFEQERNILSTYTSIAPYAIYTDDNEKETIVTVDGFVVDSEHVNKFPNRVTKPIDFSSEFGSDEIPTKARLTTLAQQYIADNEIGVPTTSIKISFLDLSQTADYADYAFLEQVNLCDDVRVHYPKLGVNTIAKVVRVVWNCLAESYDEIEIGQKRMSLASQIQEQNKAIQEINTQVNQSQVSADGKNMIFYGLYGENGLGEPTATKVGDTWYKPNGTSEDMLVWTGTIWKVVLDADTFRQIGVKIDEMEQEVQTAIDQSQTAINNASQAVADAGFAKNQSATALSQAGQAVADANSAIVDAQSALDAYNNLEIGGRNLLVGSKDYSGTWVNKAQWTVSSDTHKGTLIASRTGSWSGLGQRFNVLKGEQYTFSAYVKSTSTSVHLYFTNQFDSAGLTPGTRTITLEPDTWTYVVCVISVSSDGIMFPRFELSSNAETVYVSAMKLEKGNKATDWSPAPEDVQVQISDINGELSRKVSQQTFDTLQGTVNTQSTQINQNKADILLRATKTEVNTLTGTVSSLDSQLKLEAGKITALNSKADGHTTQIGSLESSFSGLNSTVATVKQDLEGLEIGGRNLLRDTKKELVQYSKTHWDWNPHVITGQEVFDLGIKVGVSLIYRIYIDKPTTEAGAFIQFTSTASKYRQTFGNMIATGESGWSTATVTVTEQDLLDLRDLVVSVRDKTVGTASVGLAMKKLEFGNKATDWTPAPEDMATVTQFSSLEQTVNGIQTTVVNKAEQSEVTQLASQWSATVAKVDGHTGQISNLGTMINLRLTKEQVADEILNDKTAIRGRETTNDAPQYYYDNYQLQKVREYKNTTALGLIGNYSGLLETESQGASSPWATFKQTFYTSTYTHSRSAIDGSTWGSWARVVDSSNVLSQINLSEEGVLIQGKNIWLDGNTKINDAVIKRAHIADLAITDAKIANASISSAKIISLDASKVTADTLSAITTNTGSLNVSGDLTMTTDNTFIKGTFGYGDPYTGAHNPRYFANGQMMIGRQNIQYEASVHAVNPDNSMGAWKYFGNAYFGPDTVKLRNLKSPNGVVNATTSIYGGEIVVASDYEGIDNGVTISSAGGGRITALGGATIGAGIEPSIYSNSFQINSAYRNNIAKLHLSNGPQGASFNWANKQGYADLFVGKDSYPVIWSNSVYGRAYSQSANMVINTDGSFGRASSASRYKLNISEIENLDQLAYNLLTIEPKRWNDKRETEAIAHEMNTGEDKVRDSLHLRQYHGLIAEDLRAAGLDAYISYNNKTGAIDGIEYDKLWTLLLPIIKKHQEDILELQLKMGVA